MKRNLNTDEPNLDDFFVHYDESFNQNYQNAGQGRRVRCAALEQMAVLCFWHAFAFAGKGLLASFSEATAYIA